jgi:hypothetical protein
VRADHDYVRGLEVHRQEVAARLQHPGGKPDLFPGNPLTFTNPISKAYAKRRFAVQEGAHNILANRFVLLREGDHRRVKYTGGC